jgi:peptide/nickel transport system substrate-binding protein
VQMKVVFGSSVNSVREKEEQIIKQAFQQAGIQMDIKNADAGVFFGQPDNPDAASRMNRDMEMFTRTADFPDMQSYLSTLTTKDITQKSNGWKGNNYGRYSDPQYDALYDQLTKELNPEKRAQIEIQMNDLVVNSYAVIPLVDRYSNNGHRADLINTAPSPWDSFLWNIAYWQLKK